MRQGNPNKRLRGRNGNNNNNNNNNNRKGPNPLTRTYESNGPDVKIRGTALHIAEKYVQLARDAQASGDTVTGENYLQHAEHYYRIIAAANATSPNPVFIRSEEDIAGDDDFEAVPVRAEPRAENNRSDNGYRGDNGGRGDHNRNDGNRGGDAPYQRPMRGSRHDRLVFNNGDPTVPGLGPQPVVSPPRFAPESAPAPAVADVAEEAPVAVVEAAPVIVEAAPVVDEAEAVAPRRTPRARVARAPRTPRVPVVEEPAVVPEAVEAAGEDVGEESIAAGEDNPRPRRRVRGSRGRGRRSEASGEAGAEPAVPAETE